MQGNVLGFGGVDEIYVIFRVYDLGRAGRPLGLNVYVDPETLRREGQLDFIPENPRQVSKWSVVPSTGKQMHL